MTRRDSMDKARHRATAGSRGDGGCPLARNSGSSSAGQKIADHRVVGTQVLFLDLGETALLVVVGLNQDLLVIGEALHQERHAAIVEQAEGVGLVRRHAAQTLATSAARRAVAAELSQKRSKDKDPSELSLMAERRQARHHQVEHLLGAEDGEGLHDGGDFPPAGEDRRIDHLHDVPGEATSRLIKRAISRWSQSSRRSSRSSSMRISGQAGMSMPAEQRTHCVSSGIASCP